MKSNKFAERFGIALERSGYSQRSFAKKISFEQATVNGWCRGKWEPSYDTLLLIAEILGESIDWLLGRVD